MGRKLRFALQQLLPPGGNYLGSPDAPKGIEVNPGDEIKLGAIRGGIEQLAQQLELPTSARIRALLDIPGHNPFCAESLQKFAMDLEPKLDALNHRNG